MTEKLYYIDSHMKEFAARVLSCEPADGRFAAVLDATAFFPEGGGQLADTGFIGSARVLDVQEINGGIVHYVNQPLEPDTEYSCRIDWEQRFRRMQDHSGEHIVSGLVHKKYGYNNVGFHMGSDMMTIDFDGELDTDALQEIEREANMIVAANLAVNTSFPDADTLAGLEYRSKLELSENVRIVEIEGVDRCACCAPHVSSTSEIGLIKIIGHERRRRGGAGTRVNMLCGLDAYEDYVIKQNNAVAVSNMLSAPQNATAPAVERLLSEQERLKHRVSELSRALAVSIAAGVEETPGNICVFNEYLDEPALRELVNLTAGRAGGLAAAFAGNDENGYRYIIGSRSLDLRASAKQINAGISGRGGGSREMIQGSCTAGMEEIKNFLMNFDICT